MGSFETTNQLWSSLLDPFPQAQTPKDAAVAPCSRHLSSHQRSSHSLATEHRRTVHSVLGVEKLPKNPMVNNVGHSDVDLWVYIGCIPSFQTYPFFREQKIFKKSWNILKQPGVTSEIHPQSNLRLRAYEHGVMQVLARILRKSPLVTFLMLTAEEQERIGCS